MCSTSFSHTVTMPYCVVILTKVTQAVISFRKKRRATSVAAAEIHAGYIAVSARCLPAVSYPKIPLIEPWVFVQPKKRPIQRTRSDNLRKLLCTRMLARKSRILGNFGAGCEATRLCLNTGSRFGAYGVSEYLTTLDAEFGRLL